MDKVTDAPPIASTQPTQADQFEALRVAVGRVMLSILRAAKVRDLPLPEAIERLEAVAEIFEREAVAHGHQ
jgi:hypothetical protein